MTDTITLRRDGIEATVNVGDWVKDRAGNAYEITEFWYGLEHLIRSGPTMSWTSDGYFWSSRKPSNFDIDIAKLAEQQRAARPAAVPAEAIRALVERWRAQAEIHKRELGFTAHGQANARLDCARDLLRLLGEGDG